MPIRQRGNDRKLGFLFKMFGIKVAQLITALGQLIKCGLISLNSVEESILNTDWIEKNRNPITLHEEGNIEDGVWEDSIGDNSRTSFVNKIAVGNSSLYGEVSYNDGTPFTDADLPTNFKISSNVIFNDIVVGATLFGFDESGADELWVGSISPNVRADIWGVSITGTSSFVIGDKILIELIYDNGNVKLYANENLEGSGNATRLNSNKILQFLARASTSLSGHKIIDFKITNTDTGEVIMNFDTFSSIQDTSDSNQATVQDATGQFLCTFNNTYSGYVEDDLTNLSVANEYGVAVAQALGNKVDNTYSRNRIDSSGNVISYLPAVATDTPFVVEKGKVYTSKLRSNIFTVSPDAFLISYFDRDRNFIERPQLAGGADEYTFTSLYDGFVQLCYFNAKDDDSDITNTELDDLTVMTNEGASALPYEAWEGYYKDSDLTIPYSDGELVLPRINPSTGEYLDEGRCWVAD